MNEFPKLILTFVDETGRFVIGVECVGHNRRGLSSKEKSPEGVFILSV